MLGYKAFNHNLTCRGFQYEVGQTYTIDSQEIQLCSKGFHFCQVPIDVLNYYYSPDDKYAVVKAEGKMIHRDDKSVTNQLTIVRLITREELITATTGLFVTNDGTKQWYENGKLHRLDGPAIEWSNGGKKWYDNGQFLKLSC